MNSQVILFSDSWCLLCLWRQVQVPDESSVLNPWFLESTTKTKLSDKPNSGSVAGRKSKFRLKYSQTTCIKSSLNFDLTDFFSNWQILRFCQLRWNLWHTVSSLKKLHFHYFFSKLERVRVWTSLRSALTLSAESKQARMFVILLTAQESGGVILGMLIDSRGKVCLCPLSLMQMQKSCRFLTVKERGKKPA